ncbi:glycine cleavage system aminomethyltransferase GcvT [Pseudonocardia abyssalis]|uniref:aminomethyltransferase n=1 Tax=Pseudonocardia abyssalis TaxID=2792008 RepID=A0ABS6USH8_9PSEU|nr:glycine cleavage system aminomethyltransferase GcvT [Pseudonocardia abyssalis]MBW0116850.1 glycine cleavage system aminomethyltransferase GcvT [Pseudonocardia abyssalis]MBW0135217.1 glycine cleavage system aminomethyltransferase GcvT [Pseudonocardia abyssalis]
MDDLLTSPLHDRHLALGATLGAFGGWSMPLSYPDGTVAEHTSVREGVGVFDVSHLGKLTIAGPGAADLVNRTFTADLGKIAPGQAQYTLCCTEDGGVVDDVIVYLVGPDEVLAVPNAANAAAVAEILRADAPAGVTVTDRHRDLAVLAAQGPRVGDVLPEVPELDYMAFADVDGMRVCRTGYTGERGYELLVPADGAAAVWDRLVAAGARPAGLGARDTLRTEMGYPLHGQDLSVDISPVQAGSGWAVGWAKESFRGKDALAAEKAAGPVRRLRGLRATGRGVPRAGMDVLAGGVRVGGTTSGTFSPTLKCGIALALIDSASGVGLDDTVSVDVRGRALECVVVKPPFVASHVR